MKTRIKSLKFSKRLIVNVAIALLVVLFLYAAYNKLVIYSTFVTQLKLSPPTAGYENFLAWFVPVTEIAVTVLLIIKRTRLTGLYSAFYLMLAFTAYTYVIPHFYDQQTCTCTGIISYFTWKQHFWFNVFFTGLAATGLILFSMLKRLEQRAQ